MSWIGRILRREPRDTVFYDSVTCPVCGGTKVIETPYLRSPTMNRSYARPCRRCRGTGYVVVKKHQTP
jgi:hypothetical protein